jgi:hypothetical protein
MEHGHALTHHEGPVYFALLHQYGALRILTSPLGAWDGIQLSCLYVITALALPLSLLSTKRLVELL